MPVSRSLLDAIVYLTAVHAEDPIVIEQKSVKANDAPDTDWYGGQKPSICVDIYMHVRGVSGTQNGRLACYRHERRKKVVWRQRNVIDGEAAIGRAIGDCSIDSLRH